MDNIIQKIVEIEDKAQGIIDSVKVKKEELDAEMNSQLTEMEQNIDKQTERKIKQITEREDAYLDDKLKSIKDETETNFETLNSVYENNKDTWVDTIVNNIISGQDNINTDSANADGVKTG